MNLNTFFAGIFGLGVGVIIADSRKIYEDGGEIDSSIKNDIEKILQQELPGFYHEVRETKSFFGNEPQLMILIAAKNYDINQVRGQRPQAVSLLLNLKTWELHPQVFGGSGGQSIYRIPDVNNSSEKYLAMASTKIPFRKPKNNPDAVLKSIQKFAENYKKALIENRATLKYQEYVNYDELLKN